MPLPFFNSSEGHTDSIPEIGRVVLLEDNMFGREFSVFPLRRLVENTSSATRYTEMYLETSDGNIYTIQIDRRSGRVGIADGLESRLLKRLAGTWLTDEEIMDGVLEVGMPFTYGDGKTTPPIISITAIANRSVSRDILKDDEKHRTSTIRSRFRAMIQ